MIMNEEQKDLLERIYSETGIDADYMVNEEMPEDIDAFMEELQERIGEIEVVYYSRAMEYLAEEDPSLTESLGLAHESGYTADKINSELLATILQQEKAGEKIEEFRDEIEELFYPDHIDPKICPSSPAASGIQIGERESAHKWDKDTDPVSCAECGAEYDSELHGTNA